MHHKIKLIATVVIIALTTLSIGLVLFYAFTKSSTPSVIQQEKFIPSQKIIPGQTTTFQIEKIEGFKLARSEGQNKIYEKPSELLSRPNEIRTSNNTATFERSIITVTSTSPEYIKLSQFTQKRGAPEKIIMGSKYYGSLISNYIYASKGITLVVNPNTDEIYEAQIYTPTTVNKYLKQFGSDISAVTTPPVERYN